MGPLELKMLQIVGNQIPIRSPTPPTQEELELQAYNPDDWPVTHKMLQNIQAESLQSIRNHDSDATSTVGKNTSMNEKDTSMTNANPVATATASTMSKTQVRETDGSVASYRTSQQLTTNSLSVNKMPAL